MVYLNFCITFSNTCDHLKQATRLIVDMYQFMDVDLNSIKTYIFECVSSKDNPKFFEEKKWHQKCFTHCENRVYLTNLIQKENNSILERKDLTNSAYSVLI